MKASIRHNLAIVGSVLLAGATVAFPSTVWAGAADVGAASSTVAGPTRASSSANVYVVQGVPRTSVTVAVDGRTIKRDVKAKSIVGPLDLSQGAHTVAFRAPSWSITSSFTVSSRSVDLVLHWPADKTEKPAVTAFDNNVRPVTVNHGRLTVAHTAVVPPADVRVDKKVLFSNIANGEFVSANVPAGTYSVDIVPTGQQVDPLFGPVDLPVRPGLLTRVFAIGEPKNQSMDAVVQTLPLRQAGSPAPDLIDAGSAGLVATNGHPDDTWEGTRDMALAGTAAVVVLGALVAGSGRARRRQALARAVGQLRVGRS